METNETRSGAPAGQLLSRRSVVRAGATAAWTVPLVQVVAAAPALASSGTKSNLAASVTASYATTPGGPQVHVFGTVTTSGAAATALQLTIQLPTGVTASAANVTPGSNWSAPSSVSGNTVLFTSSGTGTSRSFDFVISISSTPEGDVVAIPAASNQGTVSNGSFHLFGVSANASLGLSGVTAAYLASDASQLNVKGTVSNGSGATTTALKLKVSIPAGKYGSQPTVSSAPSGWALPVITGSSGAGWDVTFTSNGQVAATASKAIDAVIQLNDADAAKKYAGSAYQIDVVASPGNGSDATAHPAVSAAPNSTLGVTGLGGTGMPMISAGTPSKSYKVSLSVKNNGPKLISNITVTIKLSRAAESLDSVATGWTNITASGEKTTWKFQRTAAVTVNPGAATTVDPLPVFIFGAANLPTATYGASADNATTVSVP